jgi:hypothetical protein
MAESIDAVRGMRRALMAALQSTLGCRLICGKAKRLRGVSWPWCRSQCGSAGIKHYLPFD